MYEQIYLILKGWSKASDIEHQTFKLGTSLHFCDGNWWGAFWIWHGR